MEKQAVNLVINSSVLRRLVSHETCRHASVHSHGRHLLVDKTVSADPLPLWRRSLSLSPSPSGVFPLLGQGNACEAKSHALPQIKSQKPIEGKINKKKEAKRRLTSLLLIGLQMAGEDLRLILAHYF